MDDLQLTKGEQTRQKLLVAAKELFIAQGYTATTMRQIARGAGITPGAIYNHFSSKDEIFAVLLQEVAPFDHLSALLREVEADTVEKLIGQFFRRFLELLTDHQDYIRLALIDAQERDGTTLAAIVLQLFPQIQAFYQKLQELDTGHGRLRQIPFLVFMRAQISLIIGFVFTEVVAKSSQSLQLPDVNWTQALADVFLWGVLRSTESEELTR